MSNGTGQLISAVIFGSREVNGIKRSLDWGEAELGVAVAEDLVVTEVVGIDNYLEINQGKVS
jgi:hypothetical protein